MNSDFLTHRSVGTGTRTYSDTISTPLIGRAALFITISILEGVVNLQSAWLDPTKIRWAYPSLLWTTSRSTLYPSNLGKFAATLLTGNENLWATNVDFPNDTACVKEH